MLEEVFKRQTDDLFFFSKSWKIFEMELLKAFYKTCYNCYISSVEPPRNELLFLPTTGLLPKTNECILNMGLVDFENIPDSTWGNDKKTLPSPALNNNLNVSVSEPLKLRYSNSFFGCVECEQISSETPILWLIAPNPDHNRMYPRRTFTIRITLYPKNPI